MNLLHVPGAAGLDEAGRGPLAGPVVAAAVILGEEFDCEGLNDSKQLDRAKILELESRIKAEALAWSVQFVEVKDIDRLNILHASLKAMELAYFDLHLVTSKIFVDGNRVPKALAGLSEAVVKGDGKITCIAAASILAKAARDRYMVGQAEVYPGYGFEHHYGYPTPEHLRTLQHLGPCELHRRSFSPVQKALQPCLFE